MWQECKLEILSTERKICEILAALQYKSLYNISSSENRVKIQAEAYNGMRMVY